MKLLYIYSSTRHYYIENMTTSVRWSGDIQQVSRKLEFDVLNSNPLTQDESSLIPFECGKEVRFYIDEKEVFRGIIFDVNFQHDGKVSITAYDESKYLTSNYDARILKSTTASRFIQTICKEFGVATGTITDTKYVISSMVLRGDSLWDMCQKVLSKTKDETGRKYWLYAKEGKLCLSERKEQIVRWVLEDDENLTSASRRINIEELRNSVKVISGGDDKKSPSSVVSHSVSSMQKYGKMQLVEDVGELSKAKMQEKAKKLLEDKNKPKIDIQATAIGIIDVYAGRAVYVYDKLTGLNGGYYVQSDTHTFENGTHSMDLTLSITDDLPFVELAEDKPTTTKKSTKKKKTSVKTVVTEKRRLNPQTGLWETY